MISTGPGCGLIRLRTVLSPFFIFPVENVDSVISEFICTSSSEDNKPIVITIIMHGAIRAMGRDVSGGLYFVPLHGDGVEGPDVIHIGGI